MSDATPVPYQPSVPAEALRVGDAERFEAASALGEHFAAGRLGQEEFDGRVRDAYAARTRGELQALFTDLPEPAPFRPAPPPAPPGWEVGRAARERAYPGPSLPVAPLLILAIFVAVSLIARFPVFPLLFLLWFGWGRRAWR